MYKLGKTTFGSKEAKKKWILRGVLMAIEYIGKESKLSYTERGLRRLAIKDIKKLLK